VSDLHDIARRLVAHPQFNTQSRDLFMAEHLDYFGMEVRGGEIWRVARRHGERRGGGTTLIACSHCRAEQVQSNGYLRVRGMIEGVRHNVLAHRLIWTVSNGSIPIGFQINHINGNKKDNRLSNLEVVTPSQNIKHAFRTGLRTQRGSANNAARLTPEIIRTIRRRSDQGVMQRYIAAELGISQSCVSKIVRRVRWAHVTD